VSLTSTIIPLAWTRVGTWLFYTVCHYDTPAGRHTDTAIPYYIIVRFNLYSHYVAVRNWFIVKLKPHLFDQLRISLYVTIAERTKMERDEQVSALQGTVAERDRQVSALEGTVAERDRQVSALERTVAERDRQVSALEGTVAERDRQVSALGSQVLALVGTVAETDRQVSALNSQVLALVGTVAERDRQVSALKSQVLALDGQVSELNKQIERKANARIEQLELKDQTQSNVPSVSNTSVAPNYVMEGCALAAIENSDVVGELNSRVHDAEDSGIADNLHSLSLRSELDSTGGMESLGRSDSGNQEEEFEQLESSDCGCSPEGLPIMVKDHDSADDSACAVDTEQPNRQDSQSNLIGTHLLVI